MGSLRARRAAGGKRGITTSKALRLRVKCLLVSGCGGVLTLSANANVSAPHATSSSSSSPSSFSCTFSIPPSLLLAGIPNPLCRLPACQDQQNMCFPPPVGSQRGHSFTGGDTASPAAPAPHAHHAAARPPTSQMMNSAFGRQTDKCTGRSGGLVWRGGWRRRPPPRVSGRVLRLGQFATQSVTRAIGREEKGEGWVAGVGLWGFATPRRSRVGCFFLNRDHKKVPIFLFKLGGTEGKHFWGTMSTGCSRFKASFQ